MDIHERDRLWSKYYLTNDDVGFMTLRKFVKNEADLMDLSQTDKCFKAKKIFRNMLKAISREEIRCVFCFAYSPPSSLSKHDVINTLLKRI